MTIQVAEISALLWGSGSDDISSIIVIQNCGELRRGEDIYFDVKWWLVSLQSGVTSLPREYLSSREKVLRWRFSWLRILIRMGGSGRRGEERLKSVEKSEFMMTLVTSHSDNVFVHHTPSSHQQWICNFNNQTLTVSTSTFENNTLKACATLDNNNFIAK